MTIERITHTSAQRLLLIFTGWSTDSRLFRGITLPEGYDLAVAYDYADYQAPVELIDGYSEIVVVGWSFGVAAAADFMLSHTHWPVTLRVAVNGTCLPVDDEYGIPQTIFRLTADGLNELTLTKFRMRMCGGASAWRRVEHLFPPGDVEQLRYQLEQVARRDSCARCRDLFDLAVISSEDTIIPTANQLNYWADEVPTRIVKGTHLPDFARLLPSLLCDKELVAQRFARCADSYSSEASAQRIIARRLCGLMPAVADARRVIEVGAGTGMLTNLYAPQLSVEARLELWDLGHISGSLPGIHVVTDAETEVMRLASRSVDVITGSSVIQWFNAPVLFVERALKALRPGGFLAFSTYAPDNFAELQPIIGTPNYPSEGEWRRALAKLDADVTIESGKTAMDFPDSRAMLCHLRLTGVNAVSRSGAGAARAILRSEIKRLTYSAIYIVVRAR